MFAPLKTNRTGLKFCADILKRTQSDLLVRQATREPIISQGPVGRQAWNGQTVTVFGCTGFLGRYVVSQLATEGTRVVVPYRGISESVRHLRPTGDLGMIIPLEFDIRNSKQVEECMAHSDMVINLIGRDFETKNFTLEDVHIKAPARIASLAKTLGVARFLHVSHLGAKANSPAAVFSTKAKGEDLIRKDYPDATIVRPATMYGYEDELLNNIGYFKSFYLTVNEASNKLHPVCVEDVASAINEMRKNEWTAGKTFELYSPVQYIQQDIIDLVSVLLRQKINTINVPQKLLRLYGRIFDLLPYHYTSSTEIDMMGIDELPSENSNGEICTFDDLGITPQQIELAAMKFIRHYRAFEYEKLGMEINPRAFRK